LFLKNHVINCKKSTDKQLRMSAIAISVAEPELVPEPKIFWPGSGAGCVNYSRMFKNPKFFILKVEIDLKNHNFVAIYLKEPFDNHLGMSLKNMKTF
jgi:hypothetical protein